MTQLIAFLPTAVDIPAAYLAGSEDDQQFVQNLALFLTSFLNQHWELVESVAELHQPLLIALEYLVKISYVDDSGTPLDYSPFYYLFDRVALEYLVKISYVDDSGAPVEYFLFYYPVVSLLPQKNSETHPPHHHVALNFAPVG